MSDRIYVFLIEMTSITKYEMKEFESIKPKRFSLWGTPLCSAYAVFTKWAFYSHTRAHTHTHTHTHNYLFNSRLTVPFHQNIKPQHTLTTTALQTFCTSSRAQRHHRLAPLSESMKTHTDRHTAPVCRIRPAFCNIRMRRSIGGMD